MTVEAGVCDLVELVMSADDAGAMVSVNRGPFQPLPWSTRVCGCSEVDVCIWVAGNIREQRVPAPGAGVVFLHAPSVVFRLRAADAVTMLGYGFGVWWCVGGPPWAGILSVVADEVDGAVARSRGEASDEGRELDWGADVALVPLSLLRAGRELGLGAAPVALAPLVLRYQARTHAAGAPVRVGSWRAGVMLTAMLVRAMRGR